MLIQTDLASVPADTKVAAAPKKMLTISELPDGRTKVEINSSSLNLLQTCWRKSYYSLHQHLKGKRESPATAFGSAIHAALETWYLAPKEERKLPSNFKKEMELMSSGHDPGDALCYKAAKSFLTAMAPIYHLPETDKRSKENGLWILSHYFDTYKLGGKEADNYEVLKVDDKPFVEQLCSALLYEDKQVQIHFFGTIDCILRNTVTDQVIPCDHKTSSVVGNDFYNRLKPNHQYTGYIWLVNETLDIDTDMFLVNCLQVKPKPKTARGAPPHFPRQITKRTAEDIEEWKQVVVWHVLQYLGFTNWKGSREFTWPLGSPDACTLYGGCQYLQVCSSPASLRDTILNNEFISTQGDTDA